MDEVSSAQTPWQSLATETNSVSVSAVPLEKSSSSPLGSYKVQGIQAEKDLVFLFLTPYTVIVHHCSAEGVDTKDVKEKSM